MKLVGVGMTTSVDCHRDKFTRQALVQAQDQINGSRCLAVGLEHDSIIPPLGKVLTAEIQDRADGETELVITQEIFQHEKWLALDDGTVLFTAESDTDRRPFNVPREQEETELSVDPNCLPEGVSPETFFQAVAVEGDIPAFARGTHFRKSAVPDPELVLTIGKLAAATFLGKKLLDKLADGIAAEVSADAVRLYRLLRAAILRFATYPWNRPVCYLIQVPGDPLVEFAAKTSNAALLLDALVAEKYQEAIDRAASLHTLFGANKIQFLLNDRGEWDFNFLLTQEGAVIGSEASYARRGRALRAFAERVTQGADDTRLPANGEGGAPTKN